jgi:hypothetical protein
VGKNVGICSEKKDEMKNIAVSFISLKKTLNLLCFSPRFVIRLF